MSRTPAQQANALIRMPNWLGDCVMSLYAIRELSVARPDIALSAIGRTSVAQLLELVPFFETTYALPSAKGIRGSIARLKSAKRVGGKRFDFGVLLPNSLGSAVEMRLIAPDNIVGYKRDCRSPLLDTPVRLPEWEKNEHITVYYANLFRNAFAYPVADERSMPSLAKFHLKFSPESEAEHRELVEQYSLDDYIVLCAGSAFGPSKQWSVNRYVETAIAMNRAYGVKVLLLGSKGDATISDEIAAKAEGCAHSICGQTSVSVAALILQHARAFVGNDSGLMHLAALTGIPTIGLFLSTDPLRTAPLGPQVAWLTADVPCRPCKQRECKKNYICRDKITPNCIIGVLEQLLRQDYQNNPDSGGQ